MTEQRTPDALSTQAENELICEKLFGWKKRGCFSPYDGRFMGYDFLDGERPTTAPSFTTWAEAGLILDAAKSLKEYVEVHWADPWFAQIDESYSEAETGPLAIRAAALEYIKVRKS